MERYRKMVEQIPPPAGQAERLRRALETAGPRRRHVYRPWGRGKKALLAAVLAAGLLASAGAALEAVDWDPVFLERFGPESRDVPGAAGAVQDVDAVSVCGDVTLTVRQALGDRKNLYLLLDYQLPEDTDVEAVTAAEHLPPLRILLYRGRSIAWEDVQDLSREDVQLAFGWGDVSGQSTSTLGFDPESRTLTCLLECDFSEWSLWSKLLNAPIALVVEPPEIEADGETTALADHLAAVSFRPSFDVDTASGRAEGDGTVYRVELSLLSLQIRMKGRAVLGVGPDAHHAFLDSVSLRLRNGTEVAARELTPPGGGTSASSSYTSHDDGSRTGKAVFNLEFAAFLNPADVEAVLVGDLEIPLS